MANRYAVAQILLQERTCFLVATTVFFFFKSTLALELGLPNGQWLLQRFALSWQRFFQYALQFCLSLPSSTSSLFFSEVLFFNLLFAFLTQYLLPRGPNWQWFQECLEKTGGEMWFWVWITQGLAGNDSAILSGIGKVGAQRVSHMRRWSNCKSFLWWIEKMFQCDDLGIWKVQQKEFIWESGIGWLCIYFGFLFLCYCLLYG